MKANLAYVGRGALNLILVLLIVVPLQLFIRGHVANSLAVVFLSLIVIGTYLAGVRWIERRQPAELLSIRPSELAAGFGLGIALFATVMLLLWAFGVYHPSGTGRAGGLAGGFVVAFFGAIVEEILFRGFLFRLSAKVVGTAGALVFTSALFGAAHAANPGATVWSSAAIALEAGVLLGGAYALTDRLWLPIGLHVGWNFTEGIDLWYVGFRRKYNKFSYLWKFAWARHSDRGRIRPGGLDCCSHGLPARFVGFALETDPPSADWIAH